MSVTDQTDETRTVTEPTRRKKSGREKLTPETQKQVFGLLDAARHRYGPPALTAIRRYLKTITTRTRLETEIATRERELADLKNKAGVA
jgi:hypothetical protein